MSTASTEERTFLGHPTGLFVLFFAEMWERFSFYGMRALLVFYMIKGFLAYDDARAYGVYGAYTSLVYMTPFFGGLLADRLLGARVAVIIGGILMAAGHLVMTIESAVFFYLALALIITGNGFFKPNISSIVGQLYPAGSTKRDGGFTIFYMGVNLGASLSPLICGYIGETYGWHYGFGLATVGMLIGLAIFVMPDRVTQVLIGAGALGTAISLFIFVSDNSTAKIVNAFVAVSLVAAGMISLRAITLGGIPDDAGRPAGGAVRKLGPVLLGTLISIPLLSLFVSDFSIVTPSGQPVRLLSDETINQLSARDDLIGSIGGVLLAELSKPTGVLLFVTGTLALLYLLLETFRLETVARQRMYVVLILTFFAFLFFAFFEQAGSSVNNFTDRNVDRVAETRTITADEVGTTIQIQPTQEQLGYSNGDDVFTMSDLDKLRADNQADEGQEANPDFTIDWVVTEDNVGMGVADRNSELAASTFQAVNPVYILIFGLLFTALWTYLGNRGSEPPTPFKFALGLIQLGMGFAAFWLGANSADERGIVAVGWLLLGYMFQTTGELCVSPVGLSMITKLAPRVLVSTVMGSWFLATAMSQYLAAIISQFTGVSHGEGTEKVIPPPIETVHVYGGVFQNIAIAAIVAGVICLILAPLLQKWMHEKEA
jgi:proton-dependent oligopeptide transporter, POT family